MHFAIITGASRGIGKQIAVQFARITNESGVPVHVVLSARNAEKLEETKKVIEDLPTTSCGSNIIEVLPVDLSDLQEAAKTFRELLEKFNASKYDRAFLFNNAATNTAYGTIGGNLELKIDEIQKNINTMFTMEILLNSLFLKATKKIAHNKAIHAVTIVHVSSGALLHNIPSMGVYSAAKAASNKIHEVIAAEEDPTHVKVLNWAPGAVETDMGANVVVNERVTPEIRNWIAAGRNEWLTPEMSAAALFKVLLSNSFKSGAFVNVDVEVTSK